MTVAREVGREQGGQASREASVAARHERVVGLDFGPMPPRQRHRAPAPR